MENPGDQDDANEEQAGEGGGGFQVEQLRSYLNFGKMALRKRWLFAATLFGVGLVLSVLVSVYFPKTYSCTTVLMATGNQVLDSRDTPTGGGLAGATDLILRHENLEAIIRDTGLIQKFDARRAPLLRLKDRLVTFLAGSMTEKQRMAALVGTLETKIEPTVDKADLTIKVSWSDGQTAGELASAARNSFLKARHAAEISAFEEKMAILDDHSGKLREEIGVLADQLKSVRDRKLGELRETASEATKVKLAEEKAAQAAEQRFVAKLPTVAALPPDTQAPDLKTRLDALRAKLSTAESDREQRLRAAQAKLDDLKLKLTPSHPEVVAQEQQVAMLADVPSELALMRAEAKDLEGELRQREGLSAQGSGGVAGGGPGARAKAAADGLLPPDITDLLQKDNLDPGLTAQLTSTVLRYGSLREEVLSTRIELDTAQAAFNHRYQVIIPADPPTKPSKPKPGVIVGAGIFLTLLLSLVLPILSEVRKGVIVERWQVDHLRLPVLAELHLPPYSPD